MSLLVGLDLALNRLQVFRTAARMARLQELCDWPTPDQRYQMERIAYIAGLVERWAKDDRYTRRQARRKVRESARQLGAAARLGEGAEVIAGIKHQVEEFISMLRAWSDKADVLTWWLFRVQTLAFWPPRSSCSPRS